MGHGTSRLLYGSQKDGETYVETECSHLLPGERYPLIISESPPTPSQASVSQPLF